MSKHIQVICDQSNWLQSTIISAETVAPTGKVVKSIYTTCKAKDLDETLQPIFMGIVKSLQEEGTVQGKPLWLAQVVNCERTYYKERIDINTVYETDAEGNLVLDKDGNPIIVSTTETKVILSEDSVVMSLRLDLTDGTTEVYTKVVKEPSVIHLWDTLTSYKYWNERTH